MRNRAIALSVILLILILSIGAYGATTKRVATPAPSKIDPRATSFLHQMSDYLAGLPQFTVHADTTMEVITQNGQVLNTDKSVDLILQRPNHARIDSYVPEHNRQVFYNGTNITIYSPDLRYYTVIPAPPTIDEVVTMARERGVQLPLGDFAVSNPYAGLMQGVQAATFVGQSYLQGVLTNQLAFRRADMDWQIWIWASPTPLPLRLAILDKSMPAKPRFIANLTNWNVNPNIDLSAFAFVPPPGVQLVPFVPDRGITLPGGMGPSKKTTPGKAGQSKKNK